MRRIKRKMRSRVPYKVAIFTTPEFFYAILHYFIVIFFIYLFGWIIINIGIGIVKDFKRIFLDKDKDNKKEKK